MEQLFSQYADIPALQTQQKQVLKIFQETEDQLKKLSELGFKIDSAKGMAELENSTKKLKEVQDQLLATQKKLEESEKRMDAARNALLNSTKNSGEEVKKQGGAYKQLSDEMGLNIQKQIELKDRLLAVRQEIRKIKEFGDLATTNEQLRDSLVKLSEEEERLKLQIQSTNRFVKNQAREFLAAEGSLDELRAKLNQMLQVYDSLSEADKGTQFGKGALTAIQDLTDVITEQEQASKRFQRNVGNYNGSAKIIVDAFERAQRKVAEFSREAGKAGPEAVQIRKEFDALQKVVDHPQFLNVAAKIGDATAESRFFTKSLQVMRSEGLENTEAYANLEAQLAKLTQEMENTRQGIKAMSSETRGFDLFASAVGTAASAIQVFGSIAEVAGDENEDLQKSIQKLVALSNIANGVRQISLDVTKQGTAANKVYAYTQTLIATTTNASATATMRLMAVLKLSGILALATGLIYLADKMGLFGSTTDDSTEALERFELQLANANSETDLAIQKIERQLELQVELAKQQGKGAKEINDLTIAGIEEQQFKYEELAQSQNRHLKELLSGIGKYYELGAAQNLDLGLEEFRALKDNGVPTLEQAYDLMKRIKTFQLTDTFKGFSESSQEQANTILKNVEAVAEALEKAGQKEHEGKKTSATFDAQEAERRRQNAKKIAEEQKRAAEAEKKAAYDLSIFRLQLEAEQLERVKNIDVNSVAVRINAAQAEFEKRKQIIEEQKNFELKSEKITASGRILIQEQAANNLLNLEAETGIKISQIRKEYNLQQIEEAKKLEQLTKEFVDAEVNNKVQSSKDYFEKLTVEAEIFAAKEKVIAAKRFKDGEISEEQYQLSISEIDKNLQSIRLQNLILFYEQQVEILKAAGVDTLLIEKALAEARAELAGESSVKEIEFLSTKKQLLDELKVKYQELAQTIAQTFHDVIGGAFDAAKNKIQEQMDAIDELKAKEIERVNATGLADEQKAAKIKIIEARALADKEQLDRRSRAIDQRKALFERGFKAFQITTEGIQSVAKIKLAVAELTAKAAANPLLAPLIPLAASQIPFALATTTANLIALLATPIPKFAGGLNNAATDIPLALAGEKGRELQVDAKGRVSIYTEPTLTSLKKGTTIYSNAVTEDILRAVNSTKEAKINSITTSAPPVYNTPVDRTDEVVNAIKKQKQIVIINHSGIESTAYYLQQMKY